MLSVFIRRQLSIRLIYCPDDTCFLNIRWIFLGEGNIEVSGNKNTFNDGDLSQIILATETSHNWSPLDWQAIAVQPFSHVQALHDKGISVDNRIKELVLVRCIDGRPVPRNKLVPHRSVLCASHCGTLLPIGTKYSVLAKCFLLDGIFTNLETGALQYRLYIETLAARKVSESRLTGAGITIVDTLYRSRNWCRIISLLAYKPNLRLVSSRKESKVLRGKETLSEWIHHRSSIPSCYESQA